MLEFEELGVGTLSRKKKVKVLQNVSGKKVAKYVALPGIIPRLRDFATKGFDELAFLMALIYGSVRLLPPGHPYLNIANKGRFGMRNVIAVAASRLIFKRENIDQILIFFALLIAFVLMVLQFAYVIVSFAMHPAMAGSLPGNLNGLLNNVPGLGGGASAVSMTGMFDTPAGQRNTDVAFMLLDSVFGIPGFFGSCVDTTVGGAACTTASPAGFPTPFQLGLHALFEFYSLTILLIGVLIFIYYVFIVVGETAQTGTPFGKRFDHIWAPIRLVVALGLLVPTSNGLNSAQYITLYAAKIGSGFATNAWTLYNTQANMNSPLGMSGSPNDQNTTNALIAQPKAPDVNPLVQFMGVVQSCKVAYETLYQKTGAAGMHIQPFLVSGQNRELVTSNGSHLQWGDALKFYSNQDIIIRFGDDGDYTDAEGAESGIQASPNAVYPSETGGVAALCGEITIHTSDLSGLDPTGGTNNTGTAIAQADYYNMIIAMWQDPDFIHFGTRAACIHLKPAPAAGNPDANGQCTAPKSMSSDDTNLAALPPDSWRQTVIKTYQDQVTLKYVPDTYNSVVKNTDFTVGQVLNRGWGGAGIWYTKLAEWNGSLFDAVGIIPTPSKMPKVMEQIQNQKAGHDNTPDVCKQYEANQSNNQAPTTTATSDADIANMLNEVYQYWTCGATTPKTNQISQGNVVIDAINWIFGTNGLFNLQKNDNVHPLAQLVALGKGIMDATMRNLLVSMGFAAGGGFLNSISWATMSGLASMGSQLFATFATIGIVIGFTLYYVLPMMPFIYFYFAVGSWVKAIFEAMVGVPLWALAHLKIQGEGLPASTAMTGYYLIFEIFLRPILTILGLLASIGILSALVRTLNSVFSLVTLNVAGFDCGAGCTANLGIPGALEFTTKRDAYDQFFFTVLYTIVVYLMSVSCFKLIDQVPQNVMRWLGSNARAFEDGVGDPVEQLGGRVSYGTQLIGQQVIPALTGASDIAGRGLGGITSSLTTRAQSPAAAPASNSSAANTAAQGKGATPPQGITGGGKP